MQEGQQQRLLQRLPNHGRSVGELVQVAIRTEAAKHIHETAARPAGQVQLRREEGGAGQRHETAQFPVELLFRNGQNDRDTLVVVIRLVVERVTHF